MFLCQGFLKTFFYFFLKTVFFKPVTTVFVLNQRAFGHPKIRQFLNFYLANTGKNPVNLIERREVFQNEVLRAVGKCAQLISISIGIPGMDGGAAAIHKTIIDEQEPSAGPDPLRKILQHLY